MRIFVFILALSCPAICSFGQQNIKGRITNGQQGLPSATVRLLDSDSTLVKGVVTDHSGEFILENIMPGSFLISASMVGYSTNFSTRISLENADIILPEIILEEVATELNELVVKGEKQVFEQMMDRLVINVGSSVTSSGSTILDVLQKSPGIVVNRQNNSIIMNGKSGVRIMINEKIMQVPLDVLVQMLDGMNASNVEKIELITTPPAEYDAEGNAGIIHIVTKGNEEYGTHGALGLTLGYRWAETLGGNFNIGHRKQKFLYFMDYSILKNHNLHIMRMDRQIWSDDVARSVNSYSHRENITKQQNLNAGLEWKISKSTFLNILFTAYKRKWELDAHTKDFNQTTTDSTVVTDMEIDELNLWQSAAISLGLQTKINPKNEINFNLDYLYYHNDNPSYYNNNIFYEQYNIKEVSKIDLKKSTPIHFFIAKADYQSIFSPSFSWETGFKAVTSTLDNDVLTRRDVNDEWSTDPIFTSFSNFIEHVASGYISTIWKAERQWQLNSGLRYEYTYTSINTPVRKNLVKRNYGYLFPSISLIKNLDIEKGIQISYSRRITRPTYNDMAPFVFFWGPNTFSTGNTSLYPAIADAVTAGYHNKQWVISLQISRSLNEITFLQPEVDNQSNILTYRSQNLKYLNTVGLTSSYSVTLAPWWEVQSNLTAQYQIARTSHLPNNVNLYLYGLNINLVNLVRLPKGFSIEISGMYQSKSLSGISQFLPLGSLNAGIQKNFGEKGTIRLSIDDILYSNYWRIITNSPENNLDSYFNYNWHNQFIRLTYSRNFGNSKLRSVKLKSGSEEERGRIKN